MAREYASKGLVFLFLYTREAHPGENFPAHRSIEQKLVHARAFKERFRIERPILVDDLLGTGHKLYGMLPNMTYLVGRGGKVLFRADWTDPPTVEWAVQYIQRLSCASAGGVSSRTVLYGNCRLSLERSSQRKRRIRTCRAEGCERLRSRYGASAQTRTATRPHRASRDPVIHGFRFLFCCMRCLIPKPSLTQFCACLVSPVIPCFNVAASSLQQTG